MRHRDRCPRIVEKPVGPAAHQARTAIAAGDHDVRATRLELRDQLVGHVATGRDRARGGLSRNSMMMEIGGSVFFKKLFFLGFWIGQSTGDGRVEIGQRFKERASGFATVVAF
jgi:hypothetical protein